LIPHERRGHDRRQPRSSRVGAIIVSHPRENWVALRHEVALVLALLVWRAFVLGSIRCAGIAPRPPTTIIPTPISLLGRICRASHCSACPAVDIARRRAVSAMLSRVRPGYGVQGRAGLPASTETPGNSSVSIFTYTTERGENQRCAQSASQAVGADLAQATAPETVLDRLVQLKRRGTWARSRTKPGRVGGSPCR